MKRSKFLVSLAVGLIAVTMTSRGSSGNDNASSSTTTSVSPGIDRATAKAINLIATDLPGWKQLPNTSNPSDQAMASRLATCAGAKNPSLVDVVDVESPNFDQGQTEVSSDVTMVRTHADGIVDLQALQSSKLDSCVQQIAVPALKTELPTGATLSDLQINPIHPTGLPQDSFALRLDATVAIPREGSVSVSSEEIGFLSGRAEIELQTSQVQGGGPSQTLEPRLLSVLVTRAQRNGS